MSRDNIPGAEPVSPPKTKRCRPATTQALKETLQLSVTEVHFTWPCMPQEQFIQLLAQLDTSLFVFAMKLCKSTEDAKDLMQETKLRAYKNLHKFQSWTNFKARISTIMRNMFINDYRRKQTRNSVEKFVEILPDILIDTEKFQSFEEQRIWAAINFLNMKYRRPRILAYSGFKYQEIAKLESLPMGTVKNRIFCANLELQKLLTDLAPKKFVSKADKYKK